MYIRKFRTKTYKSKYVFFFSFLQTCPMKGRPEDTFLEQFSERFMDHVRQVCTFAKLIPGFKCLHHDDQVTLLKSCVFEVLLVRLAGLFDSQVSYSFLMIFVYISILVMITNFKMWYNDSKECACLAGIWNSFFSFFQIFLTNVNMLR